MYNINTVDPAHKEAYEKMTTLLQVFMNRQIQLKELNRGQTDPKKQSEYCIERDLNKETINWIQWIRYHLWGNDDATIDIKCPGIRWTLRGYKSYWRLNDWFIGTLGVEQDRIKIVPYDGSRQMHELNIVLTLLDKIKENKKSVFELVDDDNIDSITLKHEIDRMMEKLYSS